MKAAKFQVGDKVEIVPRRTHLPHVKKHYGKTLVVEALIITHYDDYYYKIKGVENYAPEDDLIISNKQHEKVN
ncbi:hypothetical protein [Proteiniphilum acetatigenes]|uniref:hypothetical protein n=1 Tax=Proteiniphilum acetatigenes TaxID=294710 RepID=UPI00037FA8C3|nr:hypothetical protein [Proteiniphilum acetatigenes]SFK99203.1 hypothetical protein SAMN05216357_11047 [Porphyromonadaceae bacterium KH3CP3RA]